MGRATGNPAVGARCHGDIVYSFVVDGAPANEIVPMFVSFASSASATGWLASNAYAVFSVTFTKADFVAQLPTAP